MIIDCHRHYMHMSDADLPHQAARQVREAATHGIATSVEHIVAGVRPMHHDPHGEVLISEMDEAGVDACVLFTVDNPAKLREDDEIMAENRAVAEQAKRFPGRVIPFACVDPRRPKAVELLQRCIEEYGARGLKLHPLRGYDLNGPETYKLLEVVQRQKLVALFHTGPIAPPRLNRLGHPLLLDDVTFNFPELKIVAGHTGLYWFRDWLAISALNDNMYGDLTLWQLDAVGHFDRFCRNLRELLDSASDRILLGTDYPAFEPIVSTKQFIKIIKRLPEEAAAGTHFTQQEVDAILGGNAQRLLGL